MLSQVRSRLHLGTRKFLAGLSREFMARPEGEPKLTPAQREFWDRNGFLVLPGHFSAHEVNVVNQLVDRLWAERRSAENPLMIDVFIGTPKEQRIYFRDAPDEARSVPYKLNDLFLEHDAVLRMSADHHLRSIMAELLDGDPIVCNNLTFERGSQQAFHFDTFYMPAPVENKMIASWVALEHAHPDSGPLRYYPGSHKIPPYKFSHGRLHVIPEELPLFDKYIEAKLQEHGLKHDIFHARRGDVFLWHSQLFHGGSAIKDPSRTRKSLVTHYFRAQDFLPDQVFIDDEGRGHLRREHQAPDSSERKTRAGRRAKPKVS